MKKIFFAAVLLAAILTVTGCKVQGGVAHMTFNNIGELPAIVVIGTIQYIKLPVGESYTYEAVWVGGKTAQVKIILYPDLGDDDDDPYSAPGGEDYILKDGDHLYIDVEFYPNE